MREFYLLNANLPKYYGFSLVQAPTKKNEAGCITTTIFAQQNKEKPWSGCKIFQKRKNRNKLYLFRFGADNRTWTCMKLLSYGPEPYASANSAISAYSLFSSNVLYYSVQRKNCQPFFAFIFKCRKRWCDFSCRHQWLKLNWKTSAQLKFWCQ